MFGKDEVIRSCCPGYITDAIYRIQNLDRSDDRFQVTTNLTEAYELLMDFVAKHTSDKFCLIDNVNTSIRGIISREVIANILVHRDYSSAFPAKVIIEKDWLKIEDDVFKISIPLDKVAAEEGREQKTLSEREQKIYNMICENLNLSVEQVMAELDISRATVFRDYAKIKKVTGAMHDKRTSTWTLD